MTIKKVGPVSVCLPSLFSEVNEGDSYCYIHCSAQSAKLQLLKSVDSWFNVGICLVLYQQN